MPRRLKPGAAVPRLRRRAPAIVAVTIAIALAVASLYALEALAGWLLPAPRPPPNPDDPYFATLAPEESHAYARAHYDSFTVWGYADFAGRHVTIENGFRRTAQPAPGFGGSSQVIWFFGGSTMLGQGSSDADTIPSQTCAELARRHVNLTWRCRNFGLGGYVSTQSMVLLLTLLREPGRERPDHVIFYDGINDVIAAWEGHPGDHHNFPHLQARIERAPHGWAMALSTALQDLRNFAASQFPRIFRLARGGGADRDNPNTGGGRKPDDRVLADAHRAAAFYIGNVHTLGDWADGARIPTVFALQPTVFTKTPLSPVEVEVRRRAEAAFAPLWQAFRDGVLTTPPADRDFLRFADLSAALNGAPDTMFYDDWMHLNAAGTRAIASRLADLIEPAELF